MLQQVLTFVALRLKYYNCMTCNIPMLHKIKSKSSQTSLITIPLSYDEKTIHTAPIN